MTCMSLVAKRATSKLSLAPRISSALDKRRYSHYKEKGPLSTENIQTFVQLHRCFQFWGLRDLQTKRTNVC